MFAQATGQGAFPLTFKEETTFVFAAAGIEMVLETIRCVNSGGMKFNFTKNKNAKYNLQLSKVLPTANILMSSVYFGGRSIPIFRISFINLQNLISTERTIPFT